MKASNTEFPAAKIIEAILFASAEPIESRELAKYLPADFALLPILHQLQADYAGRGIQLLEIDGSWVFRTDPALASYLQPLLTVPRCLSRPALETLAIIAYHQPVTRAEIEDIRGVAIHRGTLDMLIETGWVKPGARRETPGRPLTWVTTMEFLDHFSLRSLADLPSRDELTSTGLLDARPVSATLFEQLVFPEQP